MEIRKMFIRSLHVSVRPPGYRPIRVTLFSKNKCSLCDHASEVMERVLKKSKTRIDYSIVKIDDPKNREWWEKYCLDVPVLHVENPAKEESLVKVFHRLEEKDVLDRIKKAWNN